MSDDRLIVALDVPNIVQGLDLAARLGDAVSFYKIGLGMLTGGGLALANELKQEHGKRIFLDMKLFDIGATIEAAVRGLAQYDLDFLTVHGDPQVVRAAAEGKSGTNLKILAVTVLTSLDRADLDANLIKGMAKNPVIFALANPDPEVLPSVAHAIRDDILMATGRSDFPNQVNNALCFPYLVRGALDAKARQITDKMKIAAAHALSALAREPVPQEVLDAYNLKALKFGREYIIPKPFDPRLLARVSKAVAEAA